MASMLVVALGGNALQKKGDASAEAQQREAAETARQLVPLIIEGHQLVIVHGNGPQVGDILLHEEALNSSEVPTMPLDTCSAMSQGSIGYWLQQAIGNELRKQNINKPIAAIVTQTLVDPDDPAFANPTKPIGPFYDTEAEARQIAEARGFAVSEDSGRGWRRVVPSPRPREIIEKQIIADLVGNDYVIISAGGGGVPVIHTENGLKGVEAVIDKDLSASLLADMINAERLLILTSVNSVMINFGTPEEKALHSVTVEDMQKYCDAQEFGVGSMLPKVLASIDFVQKGRGSRKALITSLDELQGSLEGNGGTVIQ